MAQKPARVPPTFTPPTPDIEPRNVVPTRILQNVVNYLQTRPYNEVAQLIAELMQNSPLLEAGMAPTGNTNDPDTETKEDNLDQEKK